MKRTLLNLLFAGVLFCFGLSSALQAGRVFTDPKTGKTVIELIVDGLPNATGTDVNTRANAAIVDEDRDIDRGAGHKRCGLVDVGGGRSEEHTSELQSR